MNYIPNTKDEQELMLKYIGLNSFDELFAAIPDDIKLNTELDIPDGLTEPELAAKFTQTAKKNKVFRAIFRGAGAYNHYIPAAVKHLASRSEFVTAYTPYQPEISQGVLQAIFEYQTMICALTGMDASNASVYDGATAAAEAINMCRDKKLNKAFVSATIKPYNMRVIKTYCDSLGIDLGIVPAKDGVTDIDMLEQLVDAETAAVYVEQINFFGIIEDSKLIADTVHGKNAKTKYISGTYPIALGMLKSSGEVGADIAVGEGQPLGMPLSFGGPYLGYIAAKKDLMRKMPGRIVGETVDKNGKRAFVLTLQAREQHIRREKASSSICSNQALCAYIAGVYLASVGAEGLREIAEQCNTKARYMAQELLKIDGVSLKYSGRTFFNEFVTTLDTSKIANKNIDAKKILRELEKNNILGGIALNESDILWCVTEVNTKREIDAAVEVINSKLDTIEF